LFSSRLSSRLCRLPPASTPCPYTTLFRSVAGREHVGQRRPAALVHEHAVVDLGAGRGEELRVGHDPDAGHYQIAVEHPALLRARSEEHTSELQSPDHLVCRLLLEKKKKKT